MKMRLIIVAVIVIIIIIAIVVPRTYQRPHVRIVTNLHPTVASKKH
jgi:hypothetical protein